MALWMTLLLTLPSACRGEVKSSQEGLVGWLSKLTSAVDKGRPPSDIELAERCYRAFKRHGYDYEDAGTTTNATAQAADASSAKVGTTTNATKAIDVVYTWINGSDPQRASELELFAQKSGARATSSHKANRFRSWDELPWSLRHTYANALSLGRVLVVTAGERPYFGELFSIVDFTILA